MLLPIQRCFVQIVQRTRRFVLARLWLDMLDLVASKVSVFQSVKNVQMLAAPEVVELDAPDRGDRSGSNTRIWADQNDDEISGIHHT